MAKIMQSFTSTKEPLPAVHLVDISTEPTSQAMQILRGALRISALFGMVRVCGWHALATPPQPPLTTRVNARIAEGYTSKTALRKDAVKQLNVIMSGTSEGFEKMDGTTLQKWALENYRFLALEYGHENIVGFVGHLDEKTPHIHATIVPLTPDGRLSAKEIVGNNKKLAELQDRYATAMQSFGLERGERGSKVTHRTTQEYYKGVNSLELQNAAKIAPIELEMPPSGIFADREGYLERQKSIVTKSVSHLMDAISKTSQNVFKLFEENVKLRARNEALERERKELKNALDRSKGIENNIRRENLGRGFGR